MGGRLRGRGCRARASRWSRRHRSGPPRRGVRRSRCPRPMGTCAGHQTPTGRTAGHQPTSERRRPSMRCSASSTTLTEPGVARTVAQNLPPDAQLVVASSMPVRDLEWFGGRPARAHANRGANGIDGVVSTALGVALRGQSHDRRRRRHRARPRRRSADRSAGTARRPAHRRHRQRWRRDLLVPAPSQASSPSRASSSSSERRTAPTSMALAARPSPRRSDRHEAGGVGGPPRPPGPDRDTDRHRPVGQRQPPQGPERRRCHGIG